MYIHVHVCIYIHVYIIYIYTRVRRCTGLFVVIGYNYMYSSASGPIKPCGVWVENSLVV